MESTSSSMLAPGLDDLGTIEFFQHPDARSVSCFFLGCLFFAGIRQFIRSVTTILFYRLGNRSYHSDVEDVRVSMGKPDADGFTGQSSLPAGWKFVKSRAILLAAMAFCYTIASILEMTSLLSFSPKSGASQCGRLVITAGVLEHLATLLAFIYASIDIRLLGAGKWEQRGFFLLVVGAFGLQCAEAGLVTLSVNRLPTLAFGFCWRTRPATLCAVNAVIGILCGIYVSARLYASVVPEPTFAWRSQIVTFGDVRVTRGLSLLLLGLLTFLPGFASFGVAGDVIPLAIASVVVLGEHLMLVHVVQRNQPAVI
ncbi:hypothetical protein M407DRAFT_33174 [Tulasnella calospora MUT 4182]|uniref:Uncharacterized protein n=1 Tax=Tulasnella calospora MUT 4182 TaxID=1051891 RepID=A0A0C3Q2R8_9AGAM|nr:hypothetical protein M407DRAFT_33174 [Tulasnella calospora MUT 4182]